MIRCVYGLEVAFTVDVSEVGGRHDFFNVAIELAWRPAIPMALFPDEAEKM